MNKRGKWVLKQKNKGLLELLKSAYFIHFITFAYHSVYSPLKRHSNVSRSVSISAIEINHKKCMYVYAEQKKKLIMILLDFHEWFRKLTKYETKYEGNF